jgi:tetratricopeptide (TPR) repeat protein
MGLRCEQLFCKGRILRGEGRFDQATDCFERCFATAKLPTSKRILFISHLSDLYCELDFQQRANAYQSAYPTYTAKGRKIVEHEIGKMRDCGWPLPSLRRLLLSLLEVEIRQERYKKAESIITELLGIYSRIPEPDINDRLGHVRALIAKARISPLVEMEARWDSALLQNRTYNPEEEEVFTCGVIYLFITLARLQHENVNGAKLIFEKAVQVIRRRPPQFLIPGIGTYLFQFVTSNLHSGAGWNLPWRSE